MILVLFLHKREFIMQKYERDIGKISYSSLRELILEEPLTGPHIIYLHSTDLSNIAEEFKDIYSENARSPYRILGIELQGASDCMPGKVYFMQRFIRSINIELSI